MADEARALELVYGGHRHVLHRQAAGPARVVQHNVGPGSVQAAPLSRPPLEGGRAEVAPVEGSSLAPADLERLGVRQSQRVQSGRELRSTGEPDTRRDREGPRAPHPCQPGHARPGKFGEKCPGGQDEDRSVIIAAGPGSAPGGVVAGQPVTDAGRIIHARGGGREPCCGARRWVAARSLVPLPAEGVDPAGPARASCRGARSPRRRPTGEAVRRRTRARSAPVTATVAAPVNPHWNPLVRAAGSAAGPPVASAVLVRLAARVAITATPRAPPTSWDVLTGPEASPVSRSAIPAKAATCTGTTQHPSPKPARRTVGSRSAYV